MQSDKKSENLINKCDETTEKVSDTERGRKNALVDEHSIGSNEQSNASSSTTQGQQSPTADTSNTTVSASSASENDHQNNDQNQPGDKHDDTSRTEDEEEEEDESRVTWDTGIINASSTTFTTVKLLVSNNMAGSIIGRAGETISELQEQSSARVKLGQSGDYYPGTSERACLVHGSLDNVKKAATLILSKLYDVQSQQVESQLGRQVKEGSTQNDGTDDSSTSLSFSVRLLIPTASCGMLIGRNGTNIKKIKDTSRVNSIRLSAKEGQVNSNVHYSSESAAATSERILTISGNELNACISCVFLILEGFARHPDVCRYGNNTTSYSKISSHYGSSSSYHVRSAHSGMASVSQNRGHRAGTNYISSHHPQRLQRPGRSNNDTFDVYRSTPDNGRRHQHQVYRNSPTVGTQISHVSPHFKPSPSASAGSQSGSKHSQNMDPQRQLQTVKISISDTMVGAILGKRGQTLTHLEDQSGTKIKISQRGEFIPGTQNRIVTISGPDSESIASAKSLIREQLARNSHQGVSTSTPDSKS